MPGPAGGLTLRAQMPRLDDPKLARALSRYPWLVLVGSFVLITKFRLDGAALHAAIGGLITVVLAMNVPVLLGLLKSRAHAHTKAYKLVAFLFVLRVSALAMVIWMIG